MTTSKELMRRSRLSSLFTNAGLSLELKESVPIIAPNGEIIVVERAGLDNLVKYTVDSGPSELEFTLLNVIAMFDETMKIFCTHAKNCDVFEEKLCNCGADAAKETYVEIQAMLLGTVEH